MTFEEELLKEMNTYKAIPANWFIFKEIIDKYKLDRERVREAIEKMKGRSENRWTDKQIQDFLEMELGL